MWGSHTAMCAKRSSITSLGENCRARKPAMRSVAARSCSAETAPGFSSSTMSANWQTRLDDAGKDARPDGQNFVIENVAGIVHGNRPVMTEPEIGAGHGLQHVGKILAAHFGARARHDLRRIDHA